MASERTICTMVTLLLMACGGGDPDADGLTNAEERDLGTDPREPDSDFDGLSDADEVLYGLDPLDAADDGYDGGWPLQVPSIKDEIEGMRQEGARAEVGNRFLRVTLVDQFGEMVDLYDFAGHGKNVVIDLSAGWCPPCRDLASYLDGEDIGLDAGARDAVNAGDVYWVTFIGEDESGGPAGQRAAKSWARDFPHPKIAVLGDKEAITVDYAVEAWPTLLLLNENMKIKRITAGVDPDFMDEVASGAR